MLPTVSLAPSPSLPPPEPPYCCIRVELATIYPVPANASAAERKVVAFIRGWLHPDTLRRKSLGWLADTWDEYTHVGFMREAGKAFFVNYLDDVRRWLGPLEDDHAD